MRKIWHNGEIKDESEAVVSVYDSAMMYGDTVFEMTRSFKGKQWKLQEHIDRLFKGLEILRIDIPFSKQDIIEACKAIQLVNDFKDEHRLMINVTRGLLSIYEETGQKGSNVIITDFPLGWTVRNMGHFFDVGIEAMTPAQKSIPSRLVDQRIKNRNRMHFLIANMQAGDRWALLTDENGYITEGTGANFFIVKGETLYTPKGENILRGISRQYVIDKCPYIGFKCIETDITPYDIYSADEAFFTATPFCMLPVISLNGIQIGEGKPGPVFKQILDNWSAEVGLNIKKQIQKYERKGGERVTPYSFK